MRVPPGELTLPVIEALVAEVLLVGEDEIEAAMTRLLETEKIVAEGAGAAALAAVLAHPHRFTGRTVGVIVSGGNVDMRMLSSVIMHGLVRDGRIARLRVAITDQPGLLAKVAQLIGEAAGNIVEVHDGRPSPASRPSLPSSRSSSRRVAPAMSARSSTA